jgi:hypothetical protein
MLRPVAPPRSIPRVFVAVFLLASSALAAPSPNAKARARELITQVKAKPGASEIAKAELAQAEHALVRADRARKSGDHAHATLLENIALEWAEAASELERAAAAEKAALELEKKLVEAEKKTVRAQALLEQTAARKARASTQLVELEAAAGVASEGQAGEPKQNPKPQPEQPGAKPTPKAAAPEPEKPATKPAPEKKP